MEACVESVFPSWIAGIFRGARSMTGPALSRPSAAVREQMPRFVHVSIDSFFASVEQQLNPKLQSKPVIVGRGTVLSASQEAILAGVSLHTGIDEALRLCPVAHVVDGRFHRYAEFAETVRELLGTYTSRVKSGSLDDFYLDFEGMEDQFPDFRGTLLRLQLEVLLRTGLSVSVGAGATWAVAATASRLEGPRGMILVPRGAERNFLAKLPTKYLPGMNASRAAELAACEVTTISDLARVPRAVLNSAFGRRLGTGIWHSAHGRDAKEVQFRQQLDSTCREANLGCGTTERVELNGMIGYLCERVSIELRRANREASTIGLSIRYTDGFAAQQTVAVSSPGGKKRSISDSTHQLLEALFTRQVGIEDLAVIVGTNAARHAASVETQVSPESAELRLAVNQ